MRRVTASRTTRNITGTLSRCSDPGAWPRRSPQAQESIAQVTGETPRFFRAPAGLRNPFLDPILSRLNLQLASWTRRGFDTVNADAGRCPPPLGRSLRDGDILLLHDGHAARRLGRRRRNAGDSASAASLAGGLCARRQLRPVTLRSALAMTPPGAVATFTATSCIGRGIGQTLESLSGERSGLAHCRFETVDLDTHIGEVAGRRRAGSAARAGAGSIAATTGSPSSASGRTGSSRPSKQPRSRWGRQRVGVFLGTSTAGILQTELAYRARDPADGRAARRRSITPPRTTPFRSPTICGDACASRACRGRVLRLRVERQGIRVGATHDRGGSHRCGAGGRVSIRSASPRFTAFTLCSSAPPAPCRPFDVARDGISIGEAAAFALLERPSDRTASDAVLLLGVGESNDAYHMSAPHPEGPRRAPRHGSGAARCGPRARRHRLHQSARYRHAEQRSLREPGSDERVRHFHALQLDQGRDRPRAGRGRGAGGRHQRARPAALAHAGRSQHRRTSTRRSPPATSSHNRGAPLARVLTNSFGFGGTNCSLIFGRAG